jgi:hypothetical protein
MTTIGADGWTELFAATLENRETDPVDQIFTRHPTLDLFRQYARPASGRELVLYLEGAEDDNTVISDKSGTFNLNFAPDLLGTSVYQWSSPYVSRVRLPWQDLQENRGKEQLVALLEFHMENVQKSHAKKIAQGLHKAVPGAGEFLSLNQIVSDTTTVGGIDPATSSYWASTVLNISADDTDPTYQPIRKAFRTMRNELSVANGSGQAVTHIVAGRKVFEEFEDAFDDKVRYLISDSRDGQTRFAAYMDGDIEVRLDPDCPEDRAYFLDVNTWRFMHLNDNFMKVHPSQVITGTFDIVTPVASVLCLATNQRRANGVLIRDYGAS